MKWEKGRQNSGYEKIKLLESQRFKFDVYLLRYRKGASIPPHYDPAPFGFAHHRLNIVLKRAKDGGNFFTLSHGIHRPHKFMNNRIIFFRPDITSHMVSKVKRGARYVLSIGWLRKI